MSNITASRRSRKYEQGFNIVELMVAIAIGGILLTGAISLFINNRTTSQITQNLSRVQENGRFALDTILRDLRMAGYFGCANDMSRIETNANMGTLAGELWDPISSLEGINNYVSGDPNWLPSEFDGSGPNSLTVAPGTDLITIRYLGTRLPDHTVLGQSGSSVTVTATTNMTEGQVLGIADCGAVDVVRLCSQDLCGSDGIDDSGADPVLTVDGTLSRGYDPDVNPVAAPFVGVRYFIARNDFNNLALSRTSIGVASSGGGLIEDNRELFEGVADMQILYGLDTDGDNLADTFVTAGSANLDDDPNDWANVVAVKIGLLVVSAQGHGEDTPQDLGDLLDKTLAAFDDNFRRRIFQTTVQIRNL